MTETNLSKKRILILYATAGAGHRRAAEALAASAKNYYDAECITCMDVLQFTPLWFRRIYPELYLFLVKRVPHFWEFGYQTLDGSLFGWLLHPIVRFGNRMLCRKFKRHLKTDAPDAIVATHFFPADVVGAWKKRGWLKCPLIISITDFHPHRLWLIPEADIIIVNTESEANVCRQRGVARQRIHVLGIPTENFDIADAELPALREQYQLDPNLPLALVLSGGTTIGKFKTVAQQLMKRLSQDPVAQIVVVCGHARWTRLRLKRRARKCSVPVQILGYADRLGELMRLASVIVGKAGGLTISEALAYGTPMIFYHAIPGQEQANALHISNHGAGVLIANPQECVETILDLLADPEELERMRSAARHIGRPTAARDIMCTLINPMLGVPNE